VISAAHPTKMASTNTMRNRRIGVTRFGPVVFFENALFFEELEGGLKKSPPRVVFTRWDVASEENPERLTGKPLLHQN
jgi:hypothetical protein